MRIDRAELLALQRIVTEGDIDIAAKVMRGFSAGADFIPTQHFDLWFEIVETFLARCQREIPGSVNDALLKLITTVRAQRAKPRVSHFAFTLDVVRLLLRCGERAIAFEELQKELTSRQHSRDELLQIQEVLDDVAITVQVPQ